MPLSCFTKKSNNQSPSHSHSPLNHHHHRHNMSPSSRLLTKIKLIKSKSRRTDSIISQPQPQPLPISNQIENQSDYIPILALDIPSGSLLPTINKTTNDQIHPNSNLDQDRSIGEDVDLDVDLNNNSNFNVNQDRPNSPWVDLGERSNELDEASQLLLSGTGLSEIGKRRCQNVHFGPSQLNEIFKLFNKIIFERGLDTLGIFRPWRFSESGFQIGRLQLLLIDYLLPIPPTTNNHHNTNNNSNITKNNENPNTHNRSVKVEEVEDELVFTLVHDLIHVLKWAIRHLSYLPTRFAINSNWYNDFSTLEREKSYPSNAYTTLLLPLLNQPSQVLLNSVLELVAAVSAHADSNAMPAGHLCKILGFWILGHGTDRYISYEQLYFDWDRAGRAFEHIFLSYLRSQGNKLPKRLKELISVYPAQNNNSSKNDTIFSPRFTTKSIKVLKAQIETHGFLPNNNLNREQVPVGSEEPKSAGSISIAGSIKRGASLRSRVRTRRSASVSTSTPATVLPLPRNQSISRRPLEILKAAGTAEIATDSISLNIWESLLESSKSSERNQLLLLNETKELMDVKEFLGLIDDETLRVIELTQLSSTSTSTTGNPKQSTQITRPRSFSLETPSLTASSSPPPPLLARPSHLSTLYEDNKSFKPKPAETRSLIAHSIATSSPAAPTSSWADFVNSGFSTSNPTPLPNVSNPEPIPRVSSSTTRSTPINTRPPITKKTRTQRKPPVANSIKSVKSNIEDPPPPPLPIHKSLIKSINIISVDESFPDVWLDTLAEPMILNQWPKFLISPLPNNNKRPINEPTHLLLDENFVDELEISSDEQQRNVVSDGLHDRTELGFIHLNHSNSIDHHQPDQNISSPPTSALQLLQPQPQHKLRSVLSTIGKNSKKRISSFFYNSSSNHDDNNNDEPVNKKKKKEIKRKFGSASFAVVGSGSGIVAVPLISNAVNKEIKESDDNEKVVTIRSGDPIDLATEQLPATKISDQEEKEINQSEIVTKIVPGVDNLVVDGVGTTSAEGRIQEQEIVSTEDEVKDIHQVPLLDFKPESAALELPTEGLNASEVVVKEQECISNTVDEADPIKHAPLEDLKTGSPVLEQRAEGSLPSEIIGKEEDVAQIPDVISVHDESPIEDAPLEDLKLNSPALEKPESIAERSIQSEIVASPEEEEVVSNTVDEVDPIEHAPLEDLKSSSPVLEQREEGSVLSEIIGKEEAVAQIPDVISVHNESPIEDAPLEDLKPSFPALEKPESIAEEVKPASADQETTETIPTVHTSEPNSVPVVSSTIEDLAVIETEEKETASSKEVAEEVLVAVIEPTATEPFVTTSEPVEQPNEQDSIATKSKSDTSAPVAEVPISEVVEEPQVAGDVKSKTSVGHDVTAIVGKEDSEATISSLPPLSFPKRAGGEGEQTPQRTWRTISSSSRASKISESSSPTSPRRSLLSKASMKLKSMARSRKGSADSSFTIGPDNSVQLASPLEPTAEEDLQQPFSNLVARRSASLTTAPESTHSFTQAFSHPVPTTPIKEMSTDEISSPESSIESPTATVKVSGESSGVLHQIDHNDPYALSPSSSTQSYLATDESSIRQSFSSAQS